MAAINLAPLHAAVPLMTSLTPRRECPETGAQFNDGLASYLRHETIEFSI
jgi:hypothetical protein